MDARRLRNLAIVVVAACAPVVLVLLSRLGAGDGSRTFPSAPPWGDGVVVAGVTGQSGDLRAGDRVVAIDGAPLGQWPRDRAEVRVGDVLRYDVIRDGQPRTVAVVLREYPLAEVFRESLPIYPLMIALFAVAAYCFLRRPGDPAARALLRLGALVPLGLSANPYSTQVLDVATGRFWPTAVGDTSSLLMWGALLHFVLLLPGGRGVVARHPRWAAACCYALPVLLYLGHLALALPRAQTDLARVGVLLTISVPAANVVPLLTVAVMALGLLRARDPRARARLVWVAAALGAAIAVYLLLGRVPELVTGAPIVPWDWLLLCFLPVPLAVGAAVLRYRLFDIQVMVRRSVVLAAVGALSIVVYVGAGIGLGALLGAPPGPGPLLAGALAVLLTLWLGVRLRRRGMRLVFGDRDEPYEVVRRLGAQLEATASPQAVLQTIVETLAHALRLPYVAIELDGPENYAAARGRPSGGATIIPLAHRGEPVGRLVLDAGPALEPFGVDDRRLLEGLARQVGTSAHNLLLTARLQRSLERVVTAREEERRRLRRDIHDGLGPVLASAGLRLDLARSLLTRDPAAAGAVLDELAQTQRQALADLRRLVEGLRPPVLDQLGLLAALREHADRFAGQHGLAITVDASDDLHGLPAAVEVATYRIVAEALTNVVKHAGAATCLVRLSRDDALVVEVRDDGRGLPVGHLAGTGLLSIRERVTELGGEATIQRGPGGGTVVRARLPLPVEVLSVEAPAVDTPPVAAPPDVPAQTA